MVEIDEHGVTIEDPDQRHGARFPRSTVIWAAGVTASALARQLGEATGADVDRAGRVSVGPDLTLPGHPEVFALGDMVRVLDEDGEPQQLLGVAPVAMQEGRYVAKVVNAPARRRARAVPLSRQGQRRDHRPRARGRRHQGAQGERLPGLAALAR